MSVLATRLHIQDRLPTVVKPSEGIILEDIVEGYLEELVNRNMVEITKRRSDESPKKCRTIGVLHDIFLPRALEIGLFHLHQKPDENSNAAAKPQHQYQGLPHFKSFQPESKVLHILQRPKERHACRRNMNILERVVGARGFGLLKVLDLEGVYQPKLPENLGNLFHLRYLGLGWTFLDTLPSSLGGLLYLETLEMHQAHTYHHSPKFYTEYEASPSSLSEWILSRHICTINET
ncbi:hypothetical protein L6452_13955 [Arctium lappa]|uniref:Uncharacterized protein n=1 Tax=Arctium lappa TaxID=4217 RepID=A0ACB9CJN9_ARCLA|nr:hypothetical protein L6452_13955 [Arctium lappa]